jgi:hypothetical protein
MLALHGPVLQDTQGRVNHGPETGRSGCLDLGRCTTVIPVTLPPGIAGRVQRLAVVLEVAGLPWDPGLPWGLPPSSSAACLNV